MTQHHKNSILGGVGLRNHSIQNEMVHRKSIPQIWWNDFITRVSTN